jgi:predicted GNAT family acetyltransferase
MAGHSTPVEIPSGLLTRVGPVFTPAELRSNGYGSAITASLSEKLLAGGSRVMLYADAVNPTSNGVYQSIGYRLVDTQLEMSVVS